MHTCAPAQRNVRPCTEAEQLGHCLGRSKFHYVAVHFPMSPQHRIHSLTVFSAEVQPMHDIRMLLNMCEREHLRAPQCVKLREPAS